MVAQRAMLELTQAQYKMEVAKFAQDVSQSVQYFGKDPSNWVEAGLVASSADVPQFIQQVKEVLETHKEFGGKMEDAYKMHGEFYNMLRDLRGLEPVEFPDVPPPATFETMHAPFEKQGTSKRKAGAS